MFAIVLRCVLLPFVSWCVLLAVWCVVLFVWCVLFVIVVGCVMIAMCCEVLAVFYLKCGVCWSSIAVCRV